MSLYYYEKRLDGSDTHLSGTLSATSQPPKRLDITAIAIDMHHTGIASYGHLLYMKKVPRIWCF
jgi:hypothetical protein